MFHIDIDTYGTRYHDLRCLILSRVGSLFQPICCADINFKECFQNSGKWFIDKYYNLEPNIYDQVQKRVSEEKATIDHGKVYL